MKINITIPTYNRAHILRRAVESSLLQDYSNFTVTVVDDGSKDSTYDLVQHYFSFPNLCYIKLKENIGTSQAKNLSLLLSDYDAITFHDSDDSYDSLKLLLQSRALRGDSKIRDPDTYWTEERIEENDIAVAKHKFIRLDGKIYEIGCPVSLVDDFFENIQATTSIRGTFILPNPALFRKHVFESLGGFVDMIEEDRELRNRTLCYGFKYCFVDRPLITKFEEEQSLTLDEGTGFYSGRRVDERSMIKEQAKKMRATVDKVEFEKKFRSVIDLSEVGIEFVSNPKLLRINEAIPSTEGTIKNLREQLDEALYALNSRDIGGRI